MHQTFFANQLMAFAVTSGFNSRQRRSEVLSLLLVAGWGRHTTIY